MIDHAERAIEGLKGEAEKIRRRYNSMSMVGFDFGTTNSLISSHRPQRRRHPLPRRAEPADSLGSRIRGHANKSWAEKQRSGSPRLDSGFMGSIVRSPKKHLGRGEHHHRRGPEGPGRHRQPTWFDTCATSPRRVSEAEVLDKVTSAVVTIPVDMEGYKRRALREAFAQAGVRIAQFVHEPFAALYGFFRQRAMCRRASIVSTESWRSCSTGEAGPSI